MSVRDDFEAWECEADQGPQTDPVWLMYNPETNTYALDKIQSRWECWQASRAALAVNLPKPLPSGDYRMTVPFYRAADIIEALSAVGIEVKA